MLKFKKENVSTEEGEFELSTVGFMSNVLARFYPKRLGILYFMV